MACCLTLAGTAFAEVTCPPLKRVASVDLDIRPKGAVGVPVSLAGRKAEFALSTTAGQSAISSALADELGLTRLHSGVMVYTARNYSDEYVFAKDLIIGNLHYGQVQLRIKPGNGGPDGVLGSDLLRNYDIDLDFLARKMNVISHDHCPDNVVYWPSKMVAKLPMRIDDQNHIFFKMDLDGHEIETTIAVGTPRTTLKQDEASSIFGIDEKSPGSLPIPGRSDVYHHKFGRLSADGLVIKNPDIVVLPSPTEKVPGAMRQGRGRVRTELQIIKQAPLQLGMSTLRQLHVYIAFHDQAIYLTPAKPDATSAEESPAEE